VSTCSCRIGGCELLDGTAHSQTGKTRQQEAKSLAELSYPSVWTARKEAVRACCEEMGYLEYGFSLGV